MLGCYSMKPHFCALFPSLPAKLLCFGAAGTGDCRGGSRRRSSCCCSCSPSSRYGRGTSPPLNTCLWNWTHKAMGTLCSAVQGQAQATVPKTAHCGGAGAGDGGDDAHDHGDQCDDDLVVDVEETWPKPLSPLSGDSAKAIEYQRALRAEASMASRPAFCLADVIYQDEWLFVVNKPSGIYAGHVLETVTSMLAPRKPCQEGASEEIEANSTATGTPQLHLHLANRLDRDTSGVMIVTKCKTVAGKLTRMFQNRKARKTYVALCIGKRPPWDEIYVETGHGRSRWGAWRVYANEDIGRKLPEKASVKDMATRFEVLSVNGESVAPRCRETPEGDGLYCERRVAERDKPYENVLSASGDEIIVRAFPVTGRTHQIRLHCQFLGIPLLGDVKYGGPLVWKGSSYEAHTLHAESMSFRHPVTNEELSLLAPLPEWAALRC